MLSIISDLSDYCTFFCRVNSEKRNLYDKSEKIQKLLVL
ncbi:hypothetical protein [Morganella morganii IS15]|nr:hypothetical protein CSB69_1406 [Morganella morganii]EMP50045.1 hypothetical protein C790_02717 [Morganella morganii SC01]CDK68501.1 hypothetical protein [Morganella morganii IS15]